MDYWRYRTANESKTTKRDTLARMRYYFRPTKTAVKIICVGVSANGKLPPASLRQRPSQAKAENVVSPRQRAAAAEGRVP